MARVGVDCDGVLANFDVAYNRIVGQPDDFRPKSWYHISGATWRKIDATPNFWLTLPAYEAEVRALAQWMFAREGDDVWIVTSRRDTIGMSATRQTELWANQCGLKSGGCSFGVITVPHAEDKVNICSKLDIDWMIDDKASTIEQMDVFPYLHAALLDRPWNQGAKVKWRVKSVAEFLEAIK